METIQPCASGVAFSLDPKPKLLVCVLVQDERGGWVNPALCLSLIKLTHDERFDLRVEMVGERPLHFARNLCVAKARSWDASYLMMVDSDMTLPDTFADVLDAAISRELEVVGLPYALFNACGGKKRWAIIPDVNSGIQTFGILPPMEDGFREVGGVAGGVLIIRNDVWRKLRGPWFLYEFNNDELASKRVDEDFHFAELCRENGIKVWVHDDTAGHLKTANITGIITGDVPVQNINRDKAEYSNSTEAAFKRGEELRRARGFRLGPAELGV